MTSPGPTPDQLASLTEFINARLAEDETRAKAAQKFTNCTPWRFVPSPYGGDAPGSIEDERIEHPLTSENIIAESVHEAAWGEHIADNDPPAALRRCTLIRAMLGHAKTIGQLEDELNSEYGLVGRLDEMATETAMHRDAAAYWNWHPDYQTEWA